MAGQAPVTATQQSELLRAISELQSGYIAGVRDPRAMANRLLDILLDLTGSEFGFLGEVLETEGPTGAWLRTWAMSDISWDAESRARYHELGVPGMMEFTNRNTLFASVLTAPGAVISNDPASDKRSHGVPKGHLELKNLMGLPMKFGGELVGVASIANRPGGYDEELATFLEPLLSTMASMIIAQRNDKARREAEDAVRISEERYRLAVAGIGAGVWEWDPKSGELYWSDKLRTILGVTDPDFTPSDIEAVLSIHPEDKSRFMAAYGAHMETGSPLQERIRVKRFDDRWITIDAHGQVEWDEHGAPKRIVGSVIDVTEIEEAEARAVKAGLTAEAAIQSADMGRWQYDAVTKRVRMDLRFARMVGREEFLESGFTFEEALSHAHPDDKPSIETGLIRAFQGMEGRLSLSHRVRKPDGTYIWVQSEGAVTRRSAEGDVLEMSGIIADHTRIKEVEQEATELRRLYELAIANSDQAVFDVDLRTGSGFTSPQYYTMLGAKPPDNGGAGDLSLFLARLNAEDRDNISQLIEGKLNSGVTHSTTFRVRGDDGNYVCMEAYGSVIRDEDGKPIRVSGTLRDITERKRVEAMARQAAIRAQMALAIAGLGVWELDIKADEVVLDQALARLMGDPELALRKVTTAEMYSFTHPDDLNRIQSVLTEMTEGRRNHAVSEHRIVDAGGKQIWIKAHVTVIERDIDGTPLRVIGIVDNLAEQKASEAALKQAVEAANAASTAKSMFLANMSHEIRTPLNGVLGIAQLLALTDLDDRQTAYVQTIKSSGRALLEIIEDILDLSKIEAGKMALNLGTSDLCALLSETVDSHKPSADHKGLALTLVQSPDLPASVQMDATRVRQVLSNLLSNAIKFTETGQVTVKAARTQAGRIRIEVSDTGPGVSEAVKAQIFDRFQQADMSNSRAHEGVGLGLAIAQELVGLMSGRLDLISEPGSGACFWFELDLVEVRSPASQSLAQDNQLEVSQLAGGRVLVVDDRAVNRDVTSEMIRQIGFSPCMAVDGADALRKLSKDHYDAVLMDLHMPGMSGEEAVRRIRKGEAGNPSVPVYMVTADVTTETRDRLETLDIEAIFGKPLEMEALQRALMALQRGAA